MPGPNNNNDGRNSNTDGGDTNANTGPGIVVSFDDSVGHPQRSSSSAGAAAAAAAPSSNDNDGADTSIRISQEDAANPSTATFSENPNSPPSHRDTFSFNETSRLLGSSYSADITGDNEDSYFRVRPLGNISNNLSQHFPHSLFTPGADGTGNSNGGAGGQITNGDEWDTWKWWRTRIRYYVPIYGWLPKYQSTNLFNDLVAGFTVACLLVPQALSYGSLSNLQPINGLYTALMPVLVYSLLGTSRHLSMGPEALISMLIGTIVNDEIKHLLIGNPDPTDAEILAYSSNVAGVVCILVGVFTLVLGLIRFGFLDSMLSESSLRGFITGAAMVIIVGQSVNILGLHPDIDELPAHSSPIDKIRYMFRNTSNINSAAAIAGLCSLAFLVGSTLAKRKLKKKAPWVRNIPDILITVVVATIISTVFDLESRGVAVFGDVEASFPTPKIPTLPSSTNPKDVLTSAMTITVIGVIESLIVAREYASRNHYSVSSNRELVAVGASNIIGAIFSAYPAFGSLARSKLNDRAKAKSQLAGLFTFVFVLFSLLFLLPLLYYLPKPVLSAVIINTAISLLTRTPREIVFLAKIGAWHDLSLLTLVFVTTMLASVESGILLAVAISLIVVIKKSNVPKIKLLGHVAGKYNDFRPLPSTSNRSMNNVLRRFASRSSHGGGNTPSNNDVAEDEDEQVELVEGALIVRIEEPLYFANTGQLQARLHRLELYGDMRVHPSEEARMAPIRAVIFDVTRMPSLDGSAISIIINIVAQYHSRNVLVCFVNPCPQVEDMFDLSGLTSKVGYNMFFDKIQGALQYLNSLEVIPPLVSRGPDGSYESDDDRLGIGMVFESDI
ncbi:hypothetical protein H4219_004756 [Mycoemilia scoparia]|uniref:STAS domain-containing protein n=1 Tax=Mycoemilia scoparia TaxID=417184 RepID=A0A9W8A049_9FUNG|nr:hypothetical protein H4219_004756 [Mycoemilia scoparia]